MTVIDEFEEEVMKFLGCKYAIACNNGTAALHTAMLALNLEPSQKVITTPFSFIASSNCILYCGGTPIFADINPQTYLIDPYEVEKRLETHPEAVGVLCVHLFGKVCDMDKLLEITRKRNIWLVEDTSQAFGAEYKGRKAGTFGDIGTFSFYATKNLSTFEGGMISTNNDKLALKMRTLINHGQTSKYYHEHLGYNYRMPQICALIGLTQLKLHKKGIISELGSYGIENGHYPHLIYNQPLYNKLKIKGNCPNAEKLAKKVRKNYS